MLQVKIITPNLSFNNPDLHPKISPKPSELPMFTLQEIIRDIETSVSVCTS